jgi:proline dehydrogenase
VQQRRDDEDDSEDRKRERSGNPPEVKDSGETERADDEVQLVEAGERRPALAAGPALQERRRDVATHRAQREADGSQQRERRQVDAERALGGRVDGVERERHGDPCKGAGGGPAPGLAVAEQATPVPGATAVDRAPAAGENGGVVRDVRRQHRPQRRDEGRDRFHVRAVRPVALNRRGSVRPLTGHARKTNAEGVGVILNLLGEHYDERVLADADAAAYCRLVDDLVGTGLRVRLSVKPTQLGLDVGEDVFRENIARVVEHADEHDRFVWIDMEDHTTTDATLDAYERHARERGNVGVCVQANLRRTRADLERLADLPGNVRLVRGAYDPPAELAYRENSRVDEVYRDCLSYMFEHSEDGVAVGSHDPAMVELAAQLHDEYGTPYEIQMLMGVREGTQVELAADSEVWQYAPCGEKWFSYFYRRVLERTDNATFAIRAIVGG